MDRPGKKLKIAATEPNIRRLFEEQYRQRCTDEMLATRAGLRYRAIQEWRQGRHQPRIGDLEACWNVLGYSLKPVPIAEPQEIPQYPWSNDDAQDSIRAEPVSLRASRSSDRVQYPPKRGQDATRRDGGGSPPGDRLQR